MLQRLIKESLLISKEKFQTQFLFVSLQPLHFILLSISHMTSWFCTTCSAENQKDSEIVIFSHQSQMTYDTSKFSQLDKQIALQSGIMMLRKSLYNQYLDNCIKTNKKFTDQQFPPHIKSISETSLDQFPELKNKTILWKRISEIYCNCSLIKGKIQPSDIQQGNVGDCYFLSAISALAQNQNAILQIFQKKSPNQMLRNQYGIYKLIVNVAGQPQEIIIDDHIPVYAKSQRPIFCKPVNNEFWVVLLEKAWAKINKCYRNIAFGNPHQVFNRFSVAPVFYHSIPSQYQDQNFQAKSKDQIQFQQNLWTLILQGHKQNFPMCCGSRSHTLSDGIKPVHSYALLEAFQLESKDKKIRLVKLRNPWGHTEYVGNYSESDVFWNSVEPKIRQKIFDKQQNDGLFIMPFHAFMSNFQNIDISHSKPNYSYAFKSVILSGQKASFYKITVEKEGEVYITFQRNLERNHIQNRYQNSGVSKILIAQEYENNKFEYIDSSIETSLADATLRCKRLKVGEYVIMVSNEETQTAKQTSFLGQVLKKGTLSAYSNSFCSIEELGQVKNFVFNFFYTHAVKYNKEKTKIGIHEQSWIAKKLIESSGYGYICISSDQKDKKCFSVWIDTNQIKEAGFILELPPDAMESMKKYEGGRIELGILPGKVMVFLFRINFKRDNLMFSFPPPGFDVKRII